MARNIAVGIGIMEYPFQSSDGFWRWVDLCEQGGLDSIWQTDRIVSRILGQPRSTIDLGDLIRQNTIILFSCAAGEIGADMAALFGSLFVGFFQAALQ